MLLQPLTQTVSIAIAIAISAADQRASRISIVGFLCLAL